MKIFSRKAKTSLVNYDGEIVKFNNCVAEVSEELGNKILKGGYSDVYEYGKQPVFETPKEIQMKSNFKEKEDWYLKEIARVTNIADARKAKIAELESEVKVWKEEYEKEHKARLALVESMSGDITQKTEETKEEKKEEAVDESDIREGLLKMKKDELIAFGEDAELDMSKIKDGTKAEIIDFIISNYKE